jgi:hypothetical protein
MHAGSLSVGHPTATIKALGGCSDWCSMHCALGLILAQNDYTRLISGRMLEAGSWLHILSASRAGTPPLAP